MPAGDTRDAGLARPGRQLQGIPPGHRQAVDIPVRLPGGRAYLGLPAHTYKLVDWLVQLHQAAGLGRRQPANCLAGGTAPGGISRLCPRRTQILNRVLQEAGIFVMRDDPQGRRYGHRDPKTGRITKAFGFDLSLLMERHEEFKKIAAEAQIERNRMKTLRQQKTFARKAIARRLRNSARRDRTASPSSACCRKPPSWSKPAASAAGPTSSRWPCRPWSAGGTRSSRR